MDVRGASPDGVGQDHVDEPNHRSFVGRLLEVENVGFGEGLLAALDDLDVGVGFLELAHHVGDTGAGFVKPLEGLPDRRLRRHHRLDLQAGHEAHVVEGEDIGGIGHRQGEGIPHALDGQHAVLLGDLLRHKLQDVRIGIDLCHRDRRNRVLLGQERDEAVLGDETESDQDGPQLVRASLLLGEGPLQLLGRDELLGHQAITEAGEATLAALAGHRGGAPLSGHAPGPVVRRGHRDRVEVTHRRGSRRSGWGDRSRYLRRRDHARRRSTAYRTSQTRDDPGQILAIAQLGVDLLQGLERTSIRRVGLHDHLAESGRLGQGALLFRGQRLALDLGHGWCPSAQTGRSRRDDCTSSLCRGAASAPVRCGRVRVSARIAPMAVPASFAKRRTMPTVVRLSKMASRIACSSTAATWMLSFTP
jgi:hypothetical protein